MRKDWQKSLNGRVWSNLLSCLFFAPGLLVVWLVVGLMLELAVITGRFGSWTAVMMAGLISLTLLIAGLSWAGLWRSSWQKLWRLKLGLLLVIWLVYSFQVLVPETGFDAVWYHLPVAQQVINHHGLVYDDLVYQTLNPLFSDLFFTGGLALAGEVGAKLVAYSFGLLLMLSTWLIARKFLDKNWSLLILLVVSVFQVVTWQSASFYVDLPKAVWEVMALFCILEFWQTKHQKSWWLILSSLFIGVSLGTKAFSWLLMPILILIFGLVLSADQKRNNLTMSHKQSEKKLYKLNDRISVGAKIFIAIFLMCLIPAPFLIHAYMVTGDWFFPITQHMIKLQEIGGANVPSGNQIIGLLSYLLNRFIKLPLSPFYFLTARDYVFPLGVLLLPFSILGWRQIKKQLTHRVLLIFAVGGWLIWWFVPPLSTRYALSGFVILLLILIIGLNEYSVNHLAFKFKKIFWMSNYLFSIGDQAVLKKFKSIINGINQSKLNFPVIELALLLMVLMTFVPRIFVAVRSSRYLLGLQTTDEYLQQFYDGNIDEKLMTWRRP
ncbi:MAG: glycosyltransferase family 39 protein [Patescibacteria group bacterium]